jgi:hypothetical protein
MAAVALGGGNIHYPKKEKFEEQLRLNQAGQQ